MSIAKYQETIADSATGRPVANAAIRVYDYPSGSPATLYNENGTVSSAPIITDKDGYCFFWAKAGYYNIGVSDGAASRILTNVPIGLGLPGAPGVTTLTPSSTVLSVLDVVQKGQSVDIRHPDFGGVTGLGVVDDSPALIAALAYIVSTGKPAVLNLWGGVYKMDTGITVRCDLVTIVGSGAVLDFSGLSSGTAVTITGKGTGVNPYRQNRSVLEGVEILGPGITSPVKGIVFHTAAEAGTSHISLKNVNTRYFGQGGHIFQSNAYIITFFNCDISYCTNGSIIPSGYANYGERITYIACAFYNNSGYAITNNNPDSDYVFVACSFDYNAGLAYITRGRVFLSDGCHVEGWDYTVAPVYLGTASECTFRMDGGWFLITETGTRKVPAIVDCNTPALGGGGAWFKGVFMHNLGTTSGYFATGSGDVFVEDMSTYGIAFPYSPTAYFLSAAANKAVDGSFEATSIRDFIYIAADTGPPVDRFACQNTTVALSTDQARTGAQSLVVSKIYGVGSDCTVNILVPIRGGSRVAMQMYYKKPGSQVGSFNVTYQFVNLQGANGCGVPRIAGLSEATVAGSRTFTAAPQDWASVSAIWQNSTSRSPRNAQYMLIQINMFLMDIGALYFDDLLVTEM